MQLQSYLKTFPILTLAKGAGPAVIATYRVRRPQLHVFADDRHRHVRR